MLKKLLTITLTTLIILNTCGYYFVLIGLKAKNGIEQTRKISNGEYAGSETIIISIPLAVPYATNDQQYKEASGKVLHNDETYRLVKRRLMNGTLFMVCVKDVVDTDLEKKLTYYTETFSDQSQSTSKNSFQLNLLKDYLPVSIALSVQNTGWKQTVNFFEKGIQYSFTLLREIARPPGLA